MKKVILFLVDSLMPEILSDCMRHRTVPALRFLIERGQFWSDCVTVFPTMTASVDSSLLTGVYPDRHKVPGLVWYDPEKKEIVNYGNGIFCVWKLGIDKCAKQVIHNLNEVHLSKEVTTLFEELADRGKTSASINTIIHRGRHKHKVKLPFFLKLGTRFQAYEEISGPEVLTLGALLDTELTKEIPSYLQRAYKRYGINDGYATYATKRLVESGEQPDFTLIYLPDNDSEVHRKNPAHAEDALIKVDHHLQEILNAFPSWEEAIKQCVFIVTSDHGQTRIGVSREEYNIDLDRLLHSFRLLELGEQINDDHEVVVCNNERSAYIYPLKPEKNKQLIEKLTTESRMDIIAWKEGNGVRVREGGTRREVFYYPGGQLTDVYGVPWTLDGDYTFLDLHIQQWLIEYGDYPDVLSRIYGALYSQDIPMIVVTARPRYEFQSRFYPKHNNGGSHGSLHKYDSSIPLIITGTNEAIKTPPRLVDLKKYILQLFDYS